MARLDSTFDSSLDSSLTTLTRPFTDGEDGGTYAARSRDVSSLTRAESEEPRDRGSFYEPETEEPPLEAFWDTTPPHRSTT